MPLADTQMLSHGFVYNFTCMYQVKHRCVRMKDLLYLFIYIFIYLWLEKTNTADNMAKIALQ